MQCAIVEYAEDLGLAFTASKNGIPTTPRLGAIYKRSGVRAGWPDITIAKVGARGEPGLYVELKTVGRQLTATQQVWQARLRSDGYVCERVTSLAQFKELIKNYLTADGPPFDRSPGASPPSPGTCSACRHQPRAAHSVQNP